MGLPALVLASGRLGCRNIADFTNHGTQAVASGRRDVAEQVELFEQFVDIGGEQVAGCLAVQGHQDDGGQVAHDDGVGVDQQEQFATVFIVMMNQPDLALAAVHVVLFDAGLIRKRRQLFAQVHDVGVAFFPVIQEFEGVQNVFQGGLGAERVLEKLFLAGGHSIPSSSLASSVSISLFQGGSKVRSTVTLSTLGTCSTLVCTSLVMTGPMPQPAAVRVILMYTWLPSSVPFWIWQS